MKTRKLLWMLAAAAGLWSCADENYTVTGTLEGHAADSVYLFTLDRTPIASAAVAADGTFVLEGRTDGTDIASLTDGSRTLTLLFPEKGEIRIAYDDLHGFAAEGTPLNDRYGALNEQLATIRDRYLSMPPDATAEERDALRSEFRRTVSDAVSANLDNMLGVYLFSQTEYGTLASGGARRRLERFPEKLQRTTLLRKIRASLEAAERTEIGQPYTQLDLADTNGRRIALSDFVGGGRWVLVDFWATWCGPCREELPLLQELHGQYAGRGLTIYGVSLDNDAEAWKNYVARHGLPWPNVLAVEHGRCPAAESYDVRSIPANFLIGPDGRIAAKNLHGKELKDKLGELLR